MTALAGALFIAALSGFVALSYEILWYRMFSFATGGTASAFSLLLGAYLYGLAGGGLVGRAACGQGHRPRRRRYLLYLAGFVVLANVAGYLVVPALALACTRGACLAALPLVALSAAMLGSVFPLVCEYGIAPDRLAGARTSLVYFTNVLGSAAGTLLTGYVLLDRWPASRLAAALALVGLGLAGAVLATERPGRRAGALGGGVLALAAAGCLIGTPRLFDRLYERLLFKERFRDDVRFAHTVENRSGVVNITASRRVFGGGAYDGMAQIDLLNDRNWLVRAFAIPAFHPRPRRVLMIGLSMGAWAQVLANLPGVESLTVVEINPGYLRLIPHYPRIASLLRNRKVTIVIDDGRRWLARHPDRRFDLIVANWTFHWREHVTHVMSAEFLQLVRRHLEPGGVYYYNTTSSPEAFATGLATFPYALRFMNFLAVSDRPLEFDRARWAAELEEYAIDGERVLDPRDGAARRRLEEIVAMAAGPPPGDSVSALEDRASLVRRFGDARVITDDNMATEWLLLAAGAEQP